MTRCIYGLWWGVLFGYSTHRFIQLMANSDEYSFGHGLMSGLTDARTGLPRLAPAPLNQKTV